MLFNSYSFLLFFPIVTFLFFVIPKKWAHIWLLIASYYFYMSWNPEYALLMGFSTIVTYVSGIWIQRIKDSNGRRKTTKKKAVVCVCCIINLGILAFFKYFDFAVENILWFFERFNIYLQKPSFDVLLPVGISFYTFQALSYTIDVYRDEIKAEHSLLRYALFVSFFPQLVAGPIERSKNLLLQIDSLAENRKFNYERMVDGLTRMVWGFFLKMVLADRIAIFVNKIFETYTMYGTVVLLSGAIAFGIQVYCDFSAYSAIAIGAAKVMGFQLMENFDTPYFSRSIKEFWRRWHISLSTWFRDYIYIPLGGNRCTRIKKYRNIMITFCISGLWHGASWNYVVWGGLHGFYQIIGDLLKPVKEQINLRLGTKTDSFSYKFGQTVITFILVSITWVFFRVERVWDGFRYLKRMFLRPDLWVLHDGGLYTFGLDRIEMNIVIFSCLLLFLVSMVRYKKGLQIDAFLKKQCIWFRWGVIIGLLFLILIWGKYGLSNYNTNQFIYFQF